MISDYFSSMPTEKNKAKRIRGASESPDGDSMEDGIGKFTERQFCELMDSILDKKLEGVALKADIVNLDYKVENLKSEKDKLQQEVTGLRAELVETKRKFLETEQRQRQMNLIFKGVPYNKGENTSSVIKDFCINVLGARRDISIRRASRILSDVQQKRKLIPIIFVEFSQYEDVIYILQNTSKLRGKKFTIDRDYPEASRRIRSKLFAIRKKIREHDSNKIVQVKNTSLIIADNRFSWAAGKGVVLTNGEDGKLDLNNLLDFNILEYLETLVKEDLDKVV